MTETAVFDASGQPFEATLSRCREPLENPDFPTVRQWRAVGGQVVGHFQVYCPEELIHAAGLLPLKIRGAPLEPMQADSRFGSYLGVSNGFRGTEASSTFFTELVDEMAYKATHGIGTLTEEHHRLVFVGVWSPR